MKLSNNIMRPEKDALFYVANLGSEALRAFRAFEQQNKTACRQAVERCFLIIDEFKRLDETRLRRAEIEKFEDVLKDLLGDRPRYRVSSKEIESYFSPFAIRMAA